MSPQRRWWEARGKQNIRETARQMTHSILDMHYPNHLDEALDTDLRKRFPIQLPSVSELRERSFS
jgi:trimethylamine:corrinoid methyltransferase-like protein